MIKIKLVSRHWIVSLFFDISKNCYFNLSRSLNSSFWALAHVVFCFELSNFSGSSSLIFVKKTYLRRSWAKHWIKNDFLYSVKLILYLFVFYCFSATEWKPYRRTAKSLLSHSLHDAELFRNEMNGSGGFKLANELEFQHRQFVEHRELFNVRAAVSVIYI